MASGRLWMLVFSSLAFVHYICECSNPVKIRAQGNCKDRCQYKGTCFLPSTSTVVKDCFSQRRWSTGRVNCDIVAILLNERDACPVDQGYNIDRGFSICYKLFTKRMNYSTAQAVCHAEKGFGLMRIDNAGKAQFFYQTFKWGYTDGQLTGGQWVFSTGEPMGYLPFKPGEPRGDGSCILANKGYNDVSCESLFQFVCEKRL